MSKVDLNDAPFVEFAKHRQSWALEDHFINPGMISCVPLLIY